MILFNMNSIYSLMSSLRLRLTIVRISTLGLPFITLYLATLLEGPENISLSLTILSLGTIASGLSANDLYKDFYRSIEKKSPTIRTETYAYALNILIRVIIAIIVVSLTMQLASRSIIALSLYFFVDKLFDEFQRYCQYFESSKIKYTMFVICRRLPILASIILCKILNVELSLTISFFSLVWSIWSILYFYEVSISKTMTLIISFRVSGLFMIFERLGDIKRYLGFNLQNALKGLLDQSIISYGKMFPLFILGTYLPSLLDTHAFESFLWWNRIFLIPAAFASTALLPFTRETIMNQSSIIQSIKKSINVVWLAVYEALFFLVVVISLVIPFTSNSSFLYSMSYICYYACTNLIDETAFWRLDLTFLKIYNAVPGTLISLSAYVLRDLQLTWPLVSVSAVSLKYIFYYYLKR